MEKVEAEKAPLSALMAREMAIRGNRVLVVDTDEFNFGLYKQLGLPQPKDFMNSLSGKKGLGEKMRKFRRSEGKEKLSILEAFSSEDIPAELIVGEDGIRLVAIGKIHEYGEGCACPMGGPNGMQFVYPMSTGKGDKYAAMLKTSQ